MRARLRGAVLAAACGLMPIAASAQLFKSEDADARRAIIELRARIAEVEQSAQARYAEAMAAAAQSGAQARAQMSAQFKELLAAEVRQFDGTVAALRRSFLDLNNQFETLRAEQAQLRGRQEQVERELEEIRKSQGDAVRKATDRVAVVEREQGDLGAKHEQVSLQLQQAVDRVSARLDVQTGIYDVAEKLRADLQLQRDRSEQIKADLDRLRSDSDARLQAIGQDLQATKSVTVAQDDRLGGVEQRLTSLRSDLGTLGDRVAVHDISTRSLGERLSLFDQGLRSNDDRLRAVDVRTGEIDARVVDLDGRLGQTDGRLLVFEGRVKVLDGRVDGADTRIAGLDERIGVTDSRLGKVDSLLGTTVKRADGLEERAYVASARSEAMDGRVQAIEARALGNENLLTAVDGRVIGLTARLAEVDQRLAFVDERAAGTDARLSETQQQLTEARVGVSATDQRLASTEGRVKSVEAGLDAASTRHIALNGRVDGVDKRVFAIDTRIGDVEGRMTAFGERVLVAAERASSAAERVAAYDTRVGTVESTVNGFEGRLQVLEPLKVTLDGQEFRAVQEEKRLYEEAVAHLRGNAFDKAIQSFDLLLRRYPGSGFMHAARYGLASAQFGSRSHRDAVESFRQFVSDAPEHPRAPDAMLAMSTSQLELKDRTGARRTIEGLIKSYPGSEAAVVGRQRLPSLR